jgi:hypothetical protein
MWGKNMAAFKKNYTTKTKHRPSAKYSEGTIAKREQLSA